MAPESLYERITKSREAVAADGPPRSTPDRNKQVVPGIPQDPAPSHTRRAPLNFCSKGWPRQFPYMGLPDQRGGEFQTRLPFSECHCRSISMHLRLQASVYCPYGHKNKVFRLDAEDAVYIQICSSNSDLRDSSSNPAQRRAYSCTKGRFAYPPPKRIIAPKRRHQDSPPSATSQGKYILRSVEL